MNYGSVRIAQTRRYDSQRRRERIRSDLEDEHNGFSPVEARQWIHVQEFERFPWVTNLELPLPAVPLSDIPKDIKA